MSGQHSLNWVSGLSSGVDGVRGLHEMVEKLTPLLPPCPLPTVPGEMGEGGSTSFGLTRGSLRWNASMMAERREPAPSGRASLELNGRLELAADRLFVFGRAMLGEVARKVGSEVQGLKRVGQEKALRCDGRRRVTAQGGRGAPEPCGRREGVG